MKDDKELLAFFTPVVVFEKRPDGLIEKKIVMKRLDKISKSELYYL